MNEFSGVISTHLDQGDNTHWRQFTSCLGADPDLFFPEDEEDAQAAKAICLLCPVRGACLEYALEYREKEGVWGGLNTRERRRILRQRRLRSYK